MLLLGAATDIRMAATGAAAFIVTGPLWSAFRRQSYLPLCMALSVFVLLIYAAGEIGIRPVFEVSPAPRLAERLLELGRAGRQVGIDAVEYPLINIAGQMRILSAGRVDSRAVLPSVSASEPVASEPYETMVVSEPRLQVWCAKGYRVEKCGFCYRKWKWRDIWAVVKSHGNWNAFARMRLPYYIAIRNLSNSSLDAH